jgi:tetratricopeptide (TPR) repeat protein
MSMRAVYRISMLSAVVLAAALAAPAISYAVPPEPPQTTPPPKASTSTPPASSATTAPKKKAKKKPQQSRLDSLEDYRAAYAMIYTSQDYAGGIAKLRALKLDDNADVANLIGYSSRKLGRYDDSKYWYEKALAADPRHARTWSYYGMWHAEQGNTLKALDYLATVRGICGTQCREYVELKGVIEGTRTY